MKFRLQLILGNSTVLLIISIVSFVMFFSINSLTKNSEWVEHSHNVIDKGNSLTGFMLNQETGMRGFLVTGNEDFLTHYISGKEDFTKVIEATKELVSDDRVQLERLVKVNEAAINWSTLVAEVNISKRRGLVDSNSIAELEGIISEREGGKYMNEVTALITEFTHMENILMKQRTSESNDSAIFAKKIAIYGTLFAVFIGIIIIFFLVRLVANRMKLLMQSISSITDGDLEIEIDNSGKDEFAEALSNLKEMVLKLKEVVLEVVKVAGSISSVGSEMNDSSQVMSEGATEQASAAEEISSSMEEMVANIQQNTDNAKQTEKIAETASGEIQEGSSAVTETVKSMQTIASKISIIGEISRQTNLLALNAAVEAARAGDHGKGFAVVAAEVRKLAERSQLAATEIDEVSSNSVEVAQKSGELLKAIVPNIQKTAGLVQEITAASVEQNSGADQINNAIQQMNEIVQQNAATAEELAASSEELNAQSDYMTDVISFFKVDSGAVKSFDTIKPKTPKQQEVKKEYSERVEAVEGVRIELGSSMAGRDSQDNEFEKF